MGLPVFAQLTAALPAPRLVLAGPDGVMLQALTFRPEMEPAAVAVGVQLLRLSPSASGDLASHEFQLLTRFQSLLAKPAHAFLCEEMEERS